MNHNEEINMIKKTYSNTQFLIDKPLFDDGLKKGIVGWVVSLFFSNLILFIYLFFLKQLVSFDENVFYQVHNIMYLLLHSLTLGVYLYFLYKQDHSLKEKYFLRLFSVVPILIFLNKLVFLVAYYFNVDYLLSLYDSVSLELIATLIATVMVYYSFKNKRILHLSILTFLALVLSSIIKILCLNTDSINYILIKMLNFVDFIQTYSIFSVIIFLFMIAFILKEQND